MITLTAKLLSKMSKVVKPSEGRLPTIGSATYHGHVVRARGFMKLRTV